MDKLSVDHLLGIKFLKKSDINLIFKTALHFKEIINMTFLQMQLVLVVEIILG